MSLFTSALSLLGVLGLAKLLFWLIRPLFSPLRNLPQPPSKGFLTGNLAVYRTEATFAEHDHWLQTYGKVLHFTTILGDRLFTTDVRAVNHVLTHSMDYEKPSEVRYNLACILGNGILVTEGEQHRQQRRIMNPSFAPSSIRDLTPIFFGKAIQLCDIWKAQIISEKSNKGFQRIEVLSWLSRATLDIIGLAGFHYRFDSLNVNQEPDALNKAFAVLLHAGGLDNFTLMQTIFPILRGIPTQRKRDEQKARETMRRIGEDLLKARRQGGELEKGRDLLSVLIRANVDPELQESQRMSDEDVLAQVPTFLVAGHETTSTETTWALFALAQRKDIQLRLRNELLSVQTDTPSFDELGAERLPYLDAFVREVLRIYPAVSLTERVATKDDVIPVSETYYDRKGNVCQDVRIRKREGVLISLVALNRAKEIWGDDATEFNPDRWLRPQVTSRDVPGVWGELMSFLGGARSCIGYRFALYEMKALLFTLIRSFEFSLAVPVEMVELRSMIVARPFVRGEKGAQLPLMVRIYKDGDENGKSGKV